MPIPALGSDAHYVNPVRAQQFDCAGFMACAEYETTGILEGFLATNRARSVFVNVYDACFHDFPYDAFRTMFAL
ncbi:MAG TPA: hypothetical protein VE779_04430 [Candidatus Angelobacter sp.]|nr:hypothetical protein [Candidatus Angelobacter sp.]